MESKVTPCFFAAQVMWEIRENPPFKRTNITGILPMVGVVSMFWTFPFKVRDRYCQLGAGTRRSSLIISTTTNFCGPCFRPLGSDELVGSLVGFSVVFFGSKMRSAFFSPFRIQQKVTVGSLGLFFGEVWRLKILWPFFFDSKNELIN